MSFGSGLLVFGLCVIAGLVDSVAGGGGLITVPAMAIVLGLGPQTIGTNKVIGSVAALVALIVYLRRGHVDWRQALTFTVSAAAGSYLGSRVGPYLPARFFWWLLAATCPVILIIIWKKELWLARAKSPNLASGIRRNKGHRLGFEPSVIATGLACGVYDGAWGPGGGTFMFLSLVFIAKLPLLTALATAKFTNFTTAFVALLTYGQAGYVHLKPGSIGAMGASLGAFIGARYISKSKDAAKVLRPVLAIVVLLLMIKLFFEFQS